MPSVIAYRINNHWI